MTLYSLVPRPTPFFLFFGLRFRIHVLLSTQTEEQKERGRPGNEARLCTSLVGTKALVLMMYFLRLCPRKYIHKYIIIPQ